MFVGKLKPRISRFCADAAVVNMVYDQVWDFGGQGYSLRAFVSRCSAIVNVSRPLIQVQSTA